MLRVAVAEKPAIAESPREDLPVLADGKGHIRAGEHTAHAHPPEPLDEDWPERIWASMLERFAPDEDSAR
jgi:hypothetical protein